MGGKGIRRREKNYRAAHGGYTRLPPPPDHSKHNALPFKLRQIMSLASSIERESQDQVSDEFSKDIHLKSKKRGDLVDAVNTLHRKDKSEAGAANDSRKHVTGEQVISAEPAESGDEFMNPDSNEKKKKKRKRKQVQDLRVEMELGQTKSKLKRKERKKKYMESKKKKHNKAVTDEELHFPGREKVEFGDVVQAPPKLAFIPKSLKHMQNASQERIRLHAVEAYRNRKGWTSRPGLYLPPAITTETTP